MNLGRILFLAIFLFSLSAIIALTSVAEQMTYDTAEIYYQRADLENLTKQAELKASYQSDLTSLLKSYADQEEISYIDLENDLLNLTVPKEFQDLHFKLVSAIADLGHSGSESLVEQKLVSLEKAYAWLSSHLSYFIANSL